MPMHVGQLLRSHLSVPVGQCKGPLVPRVTVVDDVPTQPKQLQLTTPYTW